MLTIAIDGPAGSGKSTLAKNLAAQLNLDYIDTGALYRAVTYFFLQEGTPFVNEAIGKTTLQNLHLDYKSGNVFVNGKNVTDAIRTPIVAGYVSKVSALRYVRDFLLELQKKIADRGNVIMDGRDIGTVIMPHATLKVFLIASPMMRAERRQKEYQLKGQNIPLETILNEITARDEEDSTREIAPLKKAPDAVIIDTSNLTIDEMVQQVAQLLQNKG